VCGLTTEEIARAFLTAPPTLAQRIVRAKNKIKVAKIPYEVPQHDAAAGAHRQCVASHLSGFNEGYAASAGTSLTRHDLTAEAIRLGRLLVELLPEPEALGLLALMLLHERVVTLAPRAMAKSCCSRNRIARCGIRPSSPKAPSSSRAH